jgi:hypothetical protein
MALVLSVTARPHPERNRDVMFREICAADIEALLDVRAATRENAIPRERLAQMGITPTSIAEGLASGATKG